MKFIYALNEKDRDLLIARGYEQISKCKLSNKDAYVFANKSSKRATFSSEDKKKFLVTNVAYFV